MSILFASLIPLLLFACWAKIESPRIRHWFHDAWEPLCARCQNERRLYFETRR